MIQRFIATKLCSLLKSFPVVTIEGPRQSGKTTLATMTLPNWSYANLEEFAVRDLAEKDPKSFLLRYPAPAIIDEIQRVPTLLSEIQVAVDRNRSNGQYVITGSHQPRLKEGISQTLAGRTAILTLYPLSIAELESAGVVLQRDEYLFKGFLPAVYDRNQPPQDAYEAYYRTYVERDVRQLINISRQSQFELFMRLLAGRIGQVVSLDGLSGEVGVSSSTLKEWMSVLEASFIIKRLQPFYNNFGKRFVKSPKVYFTDVGLATHLLQIESPSQVARDPLAGGLFENMVVMEAFKALANQGRALDLYYMRDKNGVEVDLVHESQRRLHLYEIKSSRTPDMSMTENMSRITRLSGDIDDCSVIYSGEPWQQQEVRFVPFNATDSLFR